MVRNIIFKNGAIDKYILAKFVVPNEEYDLALAIKLAVAEYCSCKEVPYSINAYNYYNVLADMPNSFCIQQGFEKLDVEKIDAPIEILKPVTSSAEIFVMQERIIA